MLSASSRRLLTLSGRSRRRCADGMAEATLPSQNSSSLPALRDGGASESMDTKPQSKKMQAVGKNFVAGGMSGAASTVLLQPFDVVKTHMQGSQISPSPGIRDSVRLITARQGITGLWAGTVPAFVRVGLGAGIYFSMLNPILSILSTGNLNVSATTENLHKKLPPSVFLAAGAITRSIAAIMICPVTVLKTRMEYEAVSGTHYPNVPKALVHIARTEGLKGLYSGLIPTILRDAPYSGLYLLFYTTTRRTISTLLDPNWNFHMHVNFLAGGIAGASATILSHPPDVVRTKLQLESKEHSSVNALIRYIYQTNGIRGFFAGVVPRAGRRALHQAFSWTIYEEIMERSQRLFSS